MCIAGSRARGDFNDLSDYDFVIIYEKKSDRYIFDNITKEISKKCSIECGDLIKPMTFDEHKALLSKLGKRIGIEFVDTATTTCPIRTMKCYVTALVDMKLYFGNEDLFRKIDRNRKEILHHKNIMKAFRFGCYIEYLLLPVNVPIGIIQHNIKKITKGNPLGRRRKTNRYHFDKLETICGS